MRRLPGHGHDAKGSLVTNREQISIAIGVISVVVGMTVGRSIGGSFWFIVALIAATVAAFAMEGMLKAFKAVSRRGR